MKNYNTWCWRWQFFTTANIITFVDTTVTSGSTSRTIMWKRTFYATVYSIVSIFTGQRDVMSSIMTCIFYIKKRLANKCNISNIIFYLLTYAFSLLSVPFVKVTACSVSTTKKNQSDWIWNVKNSKEKVYVLFTT